MLWSHPTQGIHRLTSRRLPPKQEPREENLEEIYRNEISETEEEQCEFERSIGESTWNQQLRPTFSEVLNDFEFIEFLKNVALFWTKDDEDEAVQSLGQHSVLYKNLLMLREKFQVFKKARQQQFDQEDSDSDEQTTLTKETKNNEFKGQLEVWNTVRNGMFLS